MSTARPEREAFVVVDLGFGDAGKGTITDFLVRDRGAELVVRSNGGAQAGHNVVTADGRHHTFSQLGAGSFAGAATLLGPAFLLHPLALELEAEHLQRLGVDPWPHLLVDARCRVIGPYQQEANRRREQARGEAAHGSCGVGVGECVADDLAFPEDTLRAGQLRDRREVRRRLERRRDRKRAELEALGLDALELFDDPGLPARVAELWAGVAARWTLLDPEAVELRIATTRGLVFEGAQGVLLDETWGFHPHTTWSDITTAPALALLGPSPDRAVHRLGVVRSYATRHGAGPFPTAGSLGRSEPHNSSDSFQGRFRTGVLDAVLLHYALEVCPVDGLAVTHLDRAPNPPRLCVGYVEPGPPALVREGRLVPGAPEDLEHRERLGAWLRTVTPRILEAELLPWLEAELGPVWLESHGPTAADKRWRRLPEPRRARSSSPASRGGREPDDGDDARRSRR
jgi:adenylosuccinate synthase